MLNKIKTVFAGNAANAALGFIATILLTRMLSVSDFGKYGYLYAVSIIVVTVLDFASGTSFVIHYNKSRMDGAILANYNAFRLASLALVGASGIILFFLQRNAIDTAENLFLVSTTAAMLIGFHVQYYYQAVGRYRDNGVAAVVINAARVMALLGMLLFAAKGAASALSSTFIVLAIAQTVAAAALLFYAKNDLEWSRSFEFDREMLRSIGLLGTSNILIILTMRADVFIIRHYLDFQHLGIYHVVFSLCSAFPLLTGSLMTVLLKEFSAVDRSGEDHKAFLGRQLKLIVPGMAVTAVLVLLARPAVELLFGQRYAQSIPLLQVMLVPFSLGVVFTPLESYYYSRRPQVITIMKLLQLTATIVFSLLFIRAYGLIGAGYSALLVRLFGWAFLLGVMMLVLGKTNTPKKEHAAL